MEKTHLGSIKKHLPMIVVLLLIICGVQGWVIYRHVIHWSSDSHLFSEKILFPSSMNKNSGNRTDNTQNLFDKFFNDDIFSKNTDPFEEMQRFREQFNQMMQNPSRDMFGNSQGGWFGGGLSSDTDGIDIRTRETKNSYIITAEIPNLKENKLNINIDEDGVSIEGEFSQTVDRKDRQGNIIGKSERRQSISRQIPIAADADYDHAKIDHKGDKVIITIPKRSV